MQYPAALFSSSDWDNLSVDGDFDQSWRSQSSDYCVCVYLWLLLLCEGDLTMPHGNERFQLAGGLGYKPQQLTQKAQNDSRLD